jgi:hypothetical protein
MNKAHAKLIIQNAVATTEPRWRQYAQSWKDIDIIFINHGYEQQGFRCFRFVPFLSERGILSIDALGSILDDGRNNSPYDPSYAKGMNTDFYRELQNGACGTNGVLFQQATRLFKEQEPENCGRFYWKLLWYMLQTCSYLRHYHNSSFARYIMSEFGRYRGNPMLAEVEFLGATDTQWMSFLQAVKPWKHLKGIGENVFDYIIGDVVEAQFAKDSYKFDSANEYFLTVTGIDSLIIPMGRKTVIEFMRSLNLPYTLREINKGIYTYCSKTEAENYGYCRNHWKCQQCSVMNICDRHFLKPGRTKLKSGRTKSTD